MFKETINIWEFESKVSIKITSRFLKKLKEIIYARYRNKEQFYKLIKHKIKFTFKTFNNILKESYHEKFFIPLALWIRICEILDVSLYELQENIVAYKTSNGPNYIRNPILPVKITPTFDMIIAHNIADGTVIDPKKGREPYFGYRQFDPAFREFFIKKLESVFGEIIFPTRYFEKTTRPYCPAVLSAVFFKAYNLNNRSFLSKEARIPNEIVNKSKEHHLAVLIAFIIDEGNIDSALIAIGLKNVKLANDLFRICKRLNYKSTFSIRGEYGIVYILRAGMCDFYKDYRQLIRKYPEMSLGKWELKIEKSFRIYNRPIYKTKGNKDIIVRMLKCENLTVNEIAGRINMTRQGVRYHMNNLEKSGQVLRSGFLSKENIIYTWAE